MFATVKNGNHDVDDIAFISSHPEAYTHISHTIHKARFPQQYKL